MKTTKPKTAGRPKKETTSVVQEKRKKIETGARAAVKKSVPSEEEIRLKAYEIYHQRVARGESGSEMDDWMKAMQTFKK
jgi:hypothetical protein